MTDDIRWRRHVHPSDKANPAHRPRVIGCHQTWLRLQAVTGSTERRMKRKIRRKRLLQGKM